MLQWKKYCWVEKTDTIYYMVPFSWNVYVRERLTGGFLHAVSHKSSVPYQSLATGTSEQQATPRTEVILSDNNILMLMGMQCIMI